MCVCVGGWVGWEWGVGGLHEGSVFLCVFRNNCENKSSRGRFWQGSHPGALHRSETHPVRATGPLYCLLGCFERLNASRCKWER